MRLFGVDYATPTTDITPLKKAGVEFVCRYLAPPGSRYDWKRLSKAEASALRRAGMMVVTVFESSANRALAGRAAGVADARWAQASLAELGAPKSAPVYFAVDFDARPDQQATINAYLIGAASVLGAKRTGVYGSYYVVKRALDAKACRYGWQTYAWSGGQWDSRAWLRQWSNGRKIGNLTVDYNHALSPDFGQWNRLPTTEPTHPFPEGDSFWTWLRWRTGTGEFADFGPRNPAVRPNVPQRVPAAWWRGLRRYLDAAE